MIVFLSLCFFGIVYLLVKKEWIPWNNLAKGIVAGIYAAALLLLLVALGLYQPYTTTAMVSVPVIPLTSQVQGRVIEIPIESNAPVQKGDVLLRIDPVPYQAEVDRIKAELAAAEQNVLKLNAAVDAARAALEYAELDFERQKKAAKTSAVSQDAVDRADAQRTVRAAELAQAEVAAQSEINGVNTDVARLRASLRKAEFDLQECTIFAPDDGKVTQLFAQEGVVVKSMPITAAMSFVYDSETLILRGAFKTSSLRHIRVGDPVEVALDSQPGKIYTGKVFSMAAATGEGALVPSGNLVSSDQLMAKSPAGFVGIEIDRSQVDFMVPAGTGAAAAIYTSKGKATAIIRKFIIRMYSWRNYL